MQTHVTSRVSVFRGEEVSAHGDVVDVDVETSDPVIEGLFVSLIEERIDSRTRATMEDRTIRYFDGRAPWGTDIRKDDILKDELTDDVLKVTAVTHPRSAVHAADVVFSAKQELY